MWTQKYFMLDYNAFVNITADNIWIMIHFPLFLSTQIKPEKSIYLWQ